MKRMNFKLRMVAIVLVAALAVTPVTSTQSTIVAEAATNGIVKGPDTPDVSDSFTTKLETGENTTISITNSVLTVKVSSSEYIFKIGNITKASDAAVVNEKDGLLHIITLSGVYYVFDLYTGVQVIAYRNAANGKYCLQRNSNAYMVYGKSLINNLYFYERIQSNSVSREALMTRAEFDSIINGVDPSVVIETPAPTAEPTAAPTAEPTAVPTAEPTKEPTIEIHAETKFDFEFWWQKYIEGTITWDQLKEVMWEDRWTATSDSTENSTTYYFYDKDGKLERTETITKSKTVETGTETGKSTEVVSGTAVIELKEEGKGEVNGEAVTDAQIYVNQPIPIVIAETAAPVVNKSKLKVSKTFIILKPGKSKTITYSAKNASGSAVKAKVKNSSSLAKGKILSTKKIKITASKKATNCSYSVVTVINGNQKTEITVVISKTVKPHGRIVTSGTRIKYYDEKNDFRALLEFDSKTGELNWNGYTMSNVKSCGFIKGTNNIVVLKNNGTVYKLPFTTNGKKQKEIHSSKIKTPEKAIALNRDKYGFVVNLKLQCGGLQRVAGL